MCKWRKPKPVEKKISILVPYQPDSKIRKRNWRWLKKYYREFMPDVELIVQRSVRLPFSKPFCKTKAINKAFRKARGDIIAIVDADCYIDDEALYECARRIREARSEGFPLWYVPYRRFYRLIEVVTDDLRTKRQKPPWRYFDDPPPWWQYEHHHGPSNGHWWGALIQIMPREAFIAAGGMDEKFSGWGSEDIAFMYAVDTLYGPHKTFNGPAYHLWHPSTKFDGIPLWRGQHIPNVNSQLGVRYYNALGDPVKMKLLTEAKSLTEYEEYFLNAVVH